MWLVAVGLTMYCGFLAAMTAGSGFDGDDWHVLSWPYWHDLPGSLVSYASEFLRPVEGIYWIVLFEAFGFNRVPFHLFSLFLLLAACLLMGACLSKTFPKNHLFVALSVMFAFFLPLSSCLTYLVFTDNSRLSSLFFWASALAFQLWAQRSQSWIGLIPPIFLYQLSFLAYEASSFLIFTVPLFVWPVHRSNKDLGDRKFFVRLGAGIFGGFGGALGIRFLLLNGGVIEHSHIIPSPELVWSYAALLPFYLIAPFTHFPSNPLVWLAGALAVLVAAGVTFYCSVDFQGENSSSDASAFWERSPTLSKAVVGMAVFFLGMLPYQIAGYGAGHPGLVETVAAKWSLSWDVNLPWFNFNEASRIFSSANFGLAILVALVVTIPQKRVLRNIAQISAIISIGFMALFHSGLSSDWKEASVLRNDLLKSLIVQVPSVKPKTNFIFVDLESYHDRAAVIRGWAGIRSLIRMLYRDPSLGAWYIYPSAEAWPNTAQQQAIVLPTGFLSRGMSFEQPAPHDSLLVFKRVGSELLLVDTITSQEPTISSGISWRGANSLASNRERILPWCDVGPGPKSRAKNPWNTGLIASLGLRRVGQPSRSVLDPFPYTDSGIH